MPRRPLLLATALALAAVAGRADIGGRVLVEGEFPDAPVAGAWVHLQGQPAPGVFAGPTAPSCSTSIRSAR